METTISIDPCLRKCLDNLPRGDPDTQPDDNAFEVWLDWCQARHIVHKGRIVVDFGKWQGPRIKATEVVVHVRHLKTGDIRHGLLDMTFAGWLSDSEFIEQGSNVRVDLLI